jgi:hypothetical protein
MIMKLKIFFEELFYFLTAALAIFFVLELIWPRIVLAYFNFSWLLMFWLLIGITLLFFSADE